MKTKREKPRTAKEHAKYLAMKKWMEKRKDRVTSLYSHIGAMPPAERIARAVAVQTKIKELDILIRKGEGKMATIHQEQKMYKREIEAVIFYNEKERRSGVII